MVKPRQALKTVDFIDEYCEIYRDLFSDVRTFESFKYLHLGIISGIKRKSLPEIGKLMGLESGERLNHFLTNSRWSRAEIEKRRLWLISNIINGEEIIVIIDETGDKKKGKTTDYVKRQYIGNLGKIEQGIVSVTAFGLYKGMVFPLINEVYKPRERLKEGDEYKSKPKIGGEMLKKLKEIGFKIKLVLADSEYGESQTNFVKILEEEELPFVLAIRSNHGVWMSYDAKIKTNKWTEFERVFDTGKSENRYVREIIYGEKREIRYWQVTTDKEKLPKNSTYYIMTKIPDLKCQEVGNLYGLRNWVEYGLKQSKNELGWSDFRFTNYSRIEKWWEMVMSAFLMVSLQSKKLKKTKLKTLKPSKQGEINEVKISEHPWWDNGLGWKNTLNNLRLLLQPWCYFNLLKPWLVVIFKSSLIRSFARVFATLKQTVNSFIETIFPPNFYHSFT